MSVPVTPVIPKDFSPEWAQFVLKDWFVKSERDVNNVKITRIEATLNGEQVCKRQVSVFLATSIRVSVFAYFTIFFFYFYLFPIIQLPELNPH